MQNGIIPGAADARQTRQMGCPFSTPASVLTSKQKKSCRLIFPQQAYARPRESRFVSQGVRIVLDALRPYRYDVIVSHIAAKFNPQFTGICKKTKLPPIITLPGNTFVLHPGIESDRRKNILLDHTVHHRVNRDGTAGSFLHGQFDLLSLQTLPEVIFRIFAFHLFKEDIPHLVVAAQVFDLAYQFIFRHFASSFRFSANSSNA